MQTTEGKVWGIEQHFSVLFRVAFRSFRGCHRTGLLFLSSLIQPVDVGEGKAQRSSAPELPSMAQSRPRYVRFTPNRWQISGLGA